MTCTTSRAHAMNRRQPPPQFVRCGRCVRECAARRRLLLTHELLHLAPQCGILDAEHAHGEQPCDHTAGRRVCGCASVERTMVRWPLAWCSCLRRVNRRSPRSRWPLWRQVRREASATHVEAPLTPGPVQSGHVLATLHSRRPPCRWARAGGRGVQRARPERSTAASRCQREWTS